MQNFRQSIEFMHPDEMFDQETKKLFLKIPHMIKLIHPKIKVFDFDVPDKYSPIFRNKMVQILSPLDEKESRDADLRKHLFATQYSGDNGFFITSSHGSSIQNFIKELYKYDFESAKNLMNSYQQFSNDCTDIVNIKEKVVRQYYQLKKYLTDEKIEVADLGINFVEYSQKEESEQEALLNELYKKYGEGYHFTAYNDLDYTPFMNNGDLYIYDSSGARLYVVKNENETQKIYLIKNNSDVNIEISDWFNDFTYDHKQEYLLMAKQLTEANLIGEIKDNKLIKSSYELTVFDLIQSFIVETLYEENKIENAVPQLTFEELLENYTIQNEMYLIKERAFVDMFRDLKIIGGVLSYSDFNLMEKNENIIIKNKEITYRSIDELEEIFERKETLKINELSNEYKKQINDYLEKLKQTYNTDATAKFVEYIKNKLEYVEVKMKMK